MRKWVVVEEKPCVIRECGGKGMDRTFSGFHSHSLDIKGRVIIPAPFRDKLGSQFTVLPNNRFDALAIYPLKKWEAFSERLSRVRDTDDTGMDYLLLLMAHVQTNMQMDSQGRVLLPQTLREAVGIDKDLTFVGVLDYILIWDSERFKNRMRGLRAQLPELNSHVDTAYGVSVQQAGINPLAGGGG